MSEVETDKKRKLEREFAMPTRSIHGTMFHHYDPTIWCECISHDGYIKYHYSDIYSEIPIGILKTRLRESEGESYLVRNAIRVEIANRQLENWFITGNK